MRAKSTDKTRLPDDRLLLMETKLGEVTVHTVFHLQIIDTAVGQVLSSK